MSEAMSDPLRRRIAQLARESRGVKPRRSIYEADGGPSRSAYTHFENMVSWPWPATLRKIENTLGWQPGVVEAVLRAKPDPQRVTVKVLTGEAPVPGVAEVGLEIHLPTDLPSNLSDEQRSEARRALMQTDATSGLNSRLAEFSDYQLMRELTVRLALRHVGKTE